MTENVPLIYCPSREAGVPPELCIVVLKIVNLIKSPNVKLQSEKLKLIEWLAGLDDKSTIEKLKFIKENPRHAADWWDSLSEAERVSIDRGLSDIKNGKTSPHATVRKKYERWL